LNQSLPLVSVGIPTFNRAAMLKRSIESVLSQDYEKIEIIVSDNASTDDTQAVCHEVRKNYPNVKYIKQSNNIGPTANFADVLKRASGEYFMWLGDDDWIDPSYVSHCVSLLIADSDLALVSGSAIYYRNGLKAYPGRVFNLLDKSWAIRVARYYLLVSDNGMFYGLMRTAQLQQIIISNTMGGDWQLIASIVSLGKAIMSPVVFVHRELGGATSDYRQIAKSLGVPIIQAIFPLVIVANNALKNILFSGAVFIKRGLLPRLILAWFVFFLVLVKATFEFMGQVKRSLVSKKHVLFIAGNVINKFK
jgi:glycosyltransferase involved in cell wall biosynthesis